MTIWQGRFDGNETQHLRFFQKITLINTHALSHNTKQRYSSYQILGFACDEGVKRNKGRIGACEAPDAIRKALAPLPYIDGSNQLPSYTINDCGTITCQSSDLDTAQNSLANAVEAIVQKNHTAIVLGGGHETAFGVYKGLHKVYKNKKTIGIVNFDAHFDLRTTDDNVTTSGTPFYDANALCNKDSTAFKYFCMGVAQSGNTKSLFDNADTLGVEYVYDRDCTNNPQNAISRLKEFAETVDVLYITIDMDTFNAGVAPGVSALNPIGLHPAFVEQCIIELTQSATPISAFDTVEVNPKHDNESITAKLAGRLIHTFILYNSLK